MAAEPGDEAADKSELVRAILPGSTPFAASYSANALTVAASWPGSRTTRVGVRFRRAVDEQQQSGVSEDMLDRAGRQRLAEPGLYRMPGPAWQRTRLVARCVQ